MSVATAHRPETTAKRGPWSAIARMLLGFRTAWRADELDRALARGEDPEATPEFRLRTEQLLAPEARARVANSLEHALHMAETEPGAALGPDIAAVRARVRESTSALLQLAERLGEEPVDVQGVALAYLLTTDGTSPLYNARGPYSLEHVARGALHALEPVTVADPDAGQEKRRIAAPVGWPPRTSQSEEVPCPAP
jgi:hypothetical protein